MDPEIKTYMVKVLRTNWSEAVILVDSVCEEGAEKSALLAASELGKEFWVHSNVEKFTATSAPLEEAFHEST